MASPVAQASSTEPDERQSARWTRAPVASIAVAFILGILCDRWWEPRGLVWLVLAVLLLTTALFQRRTAWIATVCLLGSCLAVGAMRHHLRWSVVSIDDIARLAEAQPRPLWIVGVIDSPVAVVSADDSEMTPPWMKLDRSMCNLRCEEVIAGDGSVPVTGTVRLITTGHLLHVGVGDRVDVVGQLAAPRGPTNPGVWDYRAHLRRQGVRGVLDCNHPDGVRLVEARVTDRVARWRSDLREECESIFVQHLDRKTVPLASSLLLGERSQLPGEVRAAFAESGTMHLLAISGLHVGILAGLLLISCRLLNLSVPSTTAVLLIGIGAYAFVTNLRPPVVRASVLAVVVAAGWPAYRRVGAINLIATCGLVVLLINPTDLFDTGTQLSFLAVIAIGWAAGFISTQRRREFGDSILPNPFVRRPGVLNTAVRLLAEGYVVTTAIWLFTLPLTAAKFHIAAPVGFVINVLLIPYVALILALGFTTMVCGLLLPALVPLPAVLFDLSLDGLLSIVHVASTLHLGHVYLSGPPGWWLLAFYILLGITLLLRPVKRVGRWGWAMVWSWVIIGQFTTFPSPSRESLRCTFLDVGHGCCVLLELPGGETVLYDAGMFAGEQRVQRIVQSVLWERGVRQLDGIIVSHADVDHFNACSGLMRSMPVGTLLMSRSFLDFEQPAVRVLCEEAVTEGVPIRLVQSGDRLAVGPESLTARVLHPADDWRSESDNANSVVLRVEFAGRSILLPGDLEEDGLSRLLQKPRADVDVLLAPHHGSRGANPGSLDDWADPHVVIVSGGSPETTARIAIIYTRAEDILSTRDAGAVTVEIAPDGSMTLTPFLPYRGGSDNMTRSVSEAELTIPH